MNRKIAFISEHQSPLAALGGVDAGGQVVYVDKLSKQLVKMGYDVDVFTRWEDPRMPHIVDCQNGIRVIHVKAGPITYIRKEDILPFMDEFREYILDFIEHEDVHYDLIHAHFFMSGLVAAELKKKLGIPFVITFHALGKIRRLYQGENDHFPKERFAIEERIVREADQIIAECPQDREDLIIHYHANQDTITIIPCGFDQNEFHPIDKTLARMSLGLSQDEHIILQLGRMVPRKGIDTVIKALPAIKKDDSLPVRLVIVGGESDEPDPQVTPEIGRLQSLAQSLNVSEAVTFVGRKGREQLKYYYNAADIFVSTPWYEPFGITPLEAMACGTPVVGSRVGGIKFSVKENETGFLVEPNNPEELADKLSHILSNPRLAEKFRSNSLQRVNAFFTWTTVAKAAAVLYEKIILANQKQPEIAVNQAYMIDRNFTDFLETIKKSQEKLRIPLIQTARTLSQCLAEGGKILICGNGGSAADAQHFAAELVGHFQAENRRALPALALNTDSAVLTAIANDYSYEDVFSRQIEAFGQPGDILIGISTSGNSVNVIEAFQAAYTKDMICIGLLGKDGGKLAELCDISLIVPSDDTQRIQEVHTHLVHTLSELVEKQLLTGKDSRRFLQPLIGTKNGKVRKAHSQIAAMKGEENHDKS